MRALANSLGNGTLETEPIRISGYFDFRRNRKSESFHSYPGKPDAMDRFSYKSIYVPRLLFRLPFHSEIELLLGIDKDGIFGAKVTLISCTKEAATIRKGLRN